MKKALAILFAVTLIALSVMPAFALDSPKPTTANYKVTIVPGSGGGTYDFDYKTSVGDDGTQTVHLYAKPEDGYKFAGWMINGSYTALGELTDAELDITVTSDVNATPNFEKTGEESGNKNDAPAKVDNSSKSPKTGATDFVYLGAACAALVGLLIMTKKCFYKK